MEIEATQKQMDFPPYVGILNIGDYVKGKVIANTTTKNGNPVLTLELIDLKGNTTKSQSKGVYVEVDVNVGDQVNLVGHVADLKDKLPRVPVGKIVTVTFTGTVKVTKGTKKVFKVDVE